jgi:hypothetical protein
MDYKICAGPCKQSLPVTREFFYSSKLGKFGLQTECKECAKKRRRKYHIKNKKRENECGKQWHKNNRERVRKRCIQRKGKYPARLILERTKARAKKKNFSFDLTEGWVQKKLNKGICEATGIELICNEYYEDKGPFVPSIDRLDNSKGYTKDNCQMVIWIYNRAKGTSDLKTLYKMCKAFVEKYEKEI